MVTNRNVVQYSTFAFSSGGNQYRDE